MTIFLQNALLRGSHSLSARRVWRTLSSKPEGPKAGPKDCNLEVEARRASRPLVMYIIMTFPHKICKYANYAEYAPYTNYTFTETVDTIELKFIIRILTAADHFNSLELKII